MSRSPGKVYLIGAGPGDPGLLTLRGRQRLNEADLVFYDYLVNPRVLRQARGDAELVCLGRHGHGRIIGGPRFTSGWSSPLEKESLSPG